MALENTAPELAADFVDQGIVLTGGGALLHRLDEALALSTGVPVMVATDPLLCVARGPAKRLRIPDMPACSPPPDILGAGWCGSTPTIRDPNLSRSMAILLPSPHIISIACDLTSMAATER